MAQFWTPYSILPHSKIVYQVLASQKDPSFRGRKFIRSPFLTDSQETEEKNKYSTPGSESRKQFDLLVMQQIMM